MWHIDIFISLLTQIYLNQIEMILQAHPFIADRSNQTSDMLVQNGNQFISLMTLNIVGELCNEFDKSN
jgi:hypothetical protein